MKNIIIILALGLFIGFVSCSSSSNLENQEDSIKQAEGFASGNVNSNQGYNYTTIELTEFNANGQTLDHSNIFEAFRILNENASDSPEVGFEECMHLINGLKSGTPDAQARIDIQYIAYLLIDKSIVSLGNTAEKSTLLLNAVLAISEPVEWRPLTKAFEIAVPNLEVEEKNKIKNYLIDGMSRTLSGNLPILETSHERLLEDAKNNIELVRAL